MFLHRRPAQLAILTLVHFIVDFYGGLAIPLPEPTLKQHLAVNLTWIALLVGGSAMMVNFIQPISGWILPKRGLPILLLLAPISAALMACIGLSQSYWIVAMMFVVAGIGIGIVHPEAALAAHTLAGKHKGLGVSFFMSGGYFGFACGSLVSGMWVDYRSQGLARYWLLSLPGLMIACLVLFSGLHRLEGHIDEPPQTSTPQSNSLSFGPIWLLCVCIAANMCILVRFLPILMVRMFPNQGAQAWSGATVFATGVSGALGAFLWGHLSERYGRARLIWTVQLLGMPFLYLLTHPAKPSLAPVWGLLLGITLGGVFPLSVVLARQSQGLGQRLRMGLAIGGAWGMGELVFIAGGRYVDQFPDSALAPVARMFWICWVLAGAALVLAWMVHCFETRTKASG